MKRGRERSAISLFFVIMGAMIVMAAFGAGPMSGSGTHAPSWVLALAGLVFASAGVAVARSSQTVTSIAAGIIVVGLSVICAWVALFGEAEFFSGGLSLFPEATEVILARVLFGAVAILGVAITVNAVRRMVKRQ